MLKTQFLSQYPLQISPMNSQVRHAVLLFEGRQVNRGKFVKSGIGDPHIRNPASNLFYFWPEA